MLEYVLGFAFDRKTKGVLLINSNKFGKWNGIGGKVESGENPLSAMYREAREEAGLSMNDCIWQYIGSITARSYVIHIFRCFTDIDPFHYFESEEGTVMYHSSVPSYGVDVDVDWLVGMCLSKTEAKLDFNIGFA